MSWDVTTRFLCLSRGPILAVLAIFWAVASVMPVHAGDPKVPIGLDPGGEAVALITTGIDYRVSEMAKRLARDGEGEIIAWDFADGDNRPFEAGAADAAGASLIRASKGQRWVVVRVDAGRPDTLAKAMAFIARTPARRTFLTVGPLPRSAWASFRVVMKTLPHIAVLDVQCGSTDMGEASNGEPRVWAKDLGLPNATTAPCPRGP